MTTIEGIKEKAIYHFRYALLVYGRQNGFKDPFKSANKTIDEFMESLTALVAEQRAEGSREALARVAEGLPEVKDIGYEEGSKRYSWR